MRIILLRLILMPAEVLSAVNPEVKNIDTSQINPKLNFSLAK